MGKEIFKYLLLSKSFELEACWNIHDQVLEAMILQSGMGITQGIY